MAFAQSAESSTVSQTLPTAEPLAPPPRPGAVGLLLAWVLPQLLLLALNWSDARLSLQAMNAEQAKAFWIYVCSWGVVFASGVGVLGFLAGQRRPVRWPVLWGILLLPVGLKVFFEIQHRTFWPADLAPWMLSSPNPGPRQAMFLLVPSYVAAVYLLRSQLGARAGRWFGTFGLLLLVGAILYGSLRAGAFFAAPIFVALGFVLAAAGILISSTPVPDRFRWLVALGFPLGGMLLNRGFPFPADFQRFGVYALLVVNAVVVCWPNPDRPERRRLLWLARCATLPFTAYFFTIFLPHLGLWVPGLFFYGGGLLILAPFALANLHFRLIAEGWREHCAVPRSTATAFAAVGVICLLPMGLVSTFLGEKSNLDAALRGMAYQELRAGALPQVDAPALRQTLALGDLSESRRGVDVFFQVGLPLVDDLRRQLVFGGLALPGPLRAELAATYLSDEKPLKSAPRRELIEPDQSGYVASRQVATTALADAPGWEETKVRLVLRTSRPVDSEWLARLRLPTDAFVTDHALVIDGQRVPSRVVDRNTAVFVYERISRAERPQDPGLIHYVGAEEVELRVFPIPAKGERITDLTITHRAGAAGRLSLAGEPLAASADHGGPTNRLVSTPVGVALFPARGGLEKHAFVRTPVRWVLADGTVPLPPRPSAASATWRAGRSLERTGERVVPRESGEPLWPPALLGKILLAEFLRGADQLRFESRLQLDWVSQRPAPVEIAQFARTLAGDFAFAGDETMRPVAVLRCGSVVRAVAPGADVVWFDEAAAGGALEVYDRVQQRFVALAAEREPSPRIAQLAHAQLAARERELHPERFRNNSRRLWKLARDVRVLTPQTAFLVVESAAQWAALEKKEKERENAPDVLESPVSIPEPRTWALLALGGAGLAVWSWVRRRRRISP